MTDDSSRPEMNEAVLKSVRREASARLNVDAAIMRIRAAIWSHGAGSDEVNAAIADAERYFAALCMRVVTSTEASIVYTEAATIESKLQAARSGAVFARPYLDPATDSAPSEAPLQAVTPP